MRVASLAAKEGVGLRHGGLVVIVFRRRGGLRMLLRLLGLLVLGLLGLLGRVWVRIETGVIIRLADGCAGAVCGGSGGGGSALFADGGIVGGAARKVADCAADCGLDPGITTVMAARVVANDRTQNTSGYRSSNGVTRCIGISVGCVIHADSGVSVAVAVISAVVVGVGRKRIVGRVKNRPIIPIGIMAGIMMGIMVGARVSVRVMHVRRAVVITVAVMIMAVMTGSSANDLPAGRVCNRDCGCKEK